MKFTSTAFIDTPELYAEIITFMASIYHVESKFQEFSISRLELWKHYNSENDTKKAFYTPNAHIWRNAKNNSIAGICISDAGNEDIYFIVHPQTLSVMNEMINWALNTWGAAYDEIYTELYEYHNELQNILNQAGFHKLNDEYGLTRKFDLRQIDITKLTRPLPDGYQIKSADEMLDIPGRINLINNAYDIDSFTENIYNSFRSALTYRASLDLSVFSPDGLHVATCMGWVDTKNNIAEIETVGTHTDYRGRGLARLVLVECLKRLQEQGVEIAYISSFEEHTHRLYGSLNHVSESKKYTYMWKRSK